MKRFILLILFSQLIAISYAQPWLEKLPQTKSSEDLTLYEYQKAFNNYWKPYNVDNKGYYIKDGIKRKASGWKQFHRWVWDMEGQIDPQTGQFPKKGAQEIYENYQKKNLQKQNAKSANWSVVGPSSSAGGYAGVGRINCIAYHPSDLDTYWIGAPAGGLWVTTDNGSSWTCLTDNNDVLGVSDIIIPSDYATSNTIYIATGDRDAWDNRSIGVLKSTDNGSTWNTTGLSASLSDGFMVTRLLLDPNDDNTIIAATNNGVFKTTNGGASWSTQLTSVSFIDMEYKPADFSTLYGSNTNGDIYVSTNGGSTWTKTFDETGAQRIELAVTANNASVVYAVAAGSDAGLYGVYKSTNSGTSFSKVLDGSTKNLLGWNADGNDSGGQGWYDLSLATSPTDENVVLVGGINTWRSTDGGTNWSIVNHWYGAAVQAVHADKHMLNYRSNGDLFECNDGGVYISSDDGTGWVDKTNGMIISQMYKLGVSATVSGEVITGLQDNGTKLVSGGTWYDVKGGDGMECLIDYTDVNTQYGTYVRGQISRTTDHWDTNTDIEPAGAGSGAWVTPYIIDPVDHNTIYAGYSNVWKTTDQGNSWTEISDMSTSDKIRSMAIAPSNTSVLYVADRSNIWKTINGGTSWTNITGALVGTGSITYIAVKDNDENTLWVSLSGYNSNAVFESTDAGSNWSNISTGLPELPAYSIVQNKQSTGAVQLYVGTELGVYFKNGTDNWIEFNTGLPNVKIGELEIYYDDVPNNSKLYAATYGRGLWQTTVEQPNVDLPSVTTATPTNITQTSATVGGEVVSQGSDAITERGVVWNLTGNPTTEDNKIVEGATTVDAFSVPMTGLTLATTYYVRAYAVNSYGTAYGASASFTTDCNTPSTQASNLAAPTINDTDITITWSSEGDQVIVLAKKGSAVDVDPWNGVSYVVNSDFTQGEDVGDGNIAVYDGVDESVTVTNLSESTTYYFAVFKYNASEHCYNTVSPASGNATTTGYCQASGGGDEYINGVVLKDISNTGTGANGYENFTHLSTDLNKGVSYTLTIDNGNAYTGDDLGVWIDFDDNGNFDDEGENVICTTDDGATGDYDLLIPSDATSGSHRMRIRIKYGGTNCGDPCGETAYGEVEDYTVNISCPDDVTIETQPANTTACEGEMAEFTVTANNATSYQWQKDGSDISGGTAATYTLNSATEDDEGDYVCIVKNACSSVTSNSASLTVNKATQILTQPTDVDAAVGNNVNFTVVAEGANLVYQWRFDGTDIDGANNDSYQIVSVVENNAGEYTVLVSGTCGNVTSNTANLSFANGIEQLASYGINVYPNPSSGIFNVSYSQQKEGIQVLIYSLEGKVVYNEKHYSELNTIDISDKAKGMYIIRFNMEEKSIISNIIFK